MKSEKKSSNFIRWFLAWPKTTGLLVFIILMSLIIFSISQRYLVSKKNEQREMNNVLNVVRHNIDQSLKNCYTTTLTLALTINDEGVPKNFDVVGKQLVESNTSIDAVQLVPDGVIKYIYPIKGNEAAMNLNILTSPIHRKEALKSIENQKMYFAGPLELKQGGIGIVGRLPVYKNNKFWGFSAVVIRLKTLFKFSGINAIDDSKYYFQFSKKNPVTQKEDFFLPVKKDFYKNYYVSSTIPDGDWKLYLVTKSRYAHYFPIIPPSIVGTTIAILISLLIVSFLKKPAELQILVDNQTQKLLKSEMKFKTFFDQAVVGIAHIDSYSGNFIEINKQYCKLLGYTPEEMKQKNFQSITYPEDLENDLLNMKKLREGEIREYSIEKRYVTKSGDIIWVNLSVSPLWEINEEATTHFSIIEDISLKKEAEALIINSEKRFKTLFDDSPLPLWEGDFSAVKNYLIGLNLMNQDPAMVYSYFSKHPEAVYKFINLAKVIDANNECIKLHKTEDKKTLIENISQLIEVGSMRDIKRLLVAISQDVKKLNIDSRIKNMDGEYRDVNIRWNVIRGYEESLERVIISTEDITERKAAEKIILHSQQKIESLINTVDGIVWECDAETFSFSFISKKVEKILGYTSEEWLSSDTFWADHIYPEDREWAINYCVSKTNENSNHDFEYRMIAKNGKIVWLRDIVNVVMKKGKAFSLRGIMIDVTKMKEAEIDLNNSFNLVTEQNKRLLNFSYIVSHNLRSHTSNIESITNLIESSESEEETNQMVQLLKSASISLNETMLDLNEVVNIQTNIGLVSEKLNLKKYVDDVQNILSKQIIAKDVTISTNITDAIFINYNPAYLESILLNLISNAIRYSHPDRKPLISITWSEENNIKMLQISDNGIGIDLQKNGGKIFGMYKTFSDNVESRGIGLFITKNQIDAMGGNIAVESEINVGTTFKILIK